jgi:uncharacterized ion transporter superfamily protein YfcC
MSKPKYQAAKAYFTILEVIAFLILIGGFIATIERFQNAGQVVGAITGMATMLTCLAIFALVQIGQATIHMAEDTRRMADLIEAQGKVAAQSEAPATGQLVARR